MKLRFTRRGAAELDSILAYIKERSPSGSENVKRRVQAVIEELREQPDLGRSAGKRNLRKVVAFPYPYLIFYSVRGEEIVIHGVRHGARRPSSMPDSA